MLDKSADYYKIESNDRTVIKYLMKSGTADKHACTS